MWKKPIVRTIFAIALGAMAGAWTRYYLGLGVDQFLGSEMPYGTLIIKVTGCFVMGFLAVFSLGQVISIHPDIRLLLLTGFLGSYTTFSSYELDSAKLLQKRRLEPDLLRSPAHGVFTCIGMHPAVGFLGSYTTFSTYELDTSNFLRTGNYKQGFLYWFGSPVLGFLCVEIGMVLAQQL